MVCIGGRKFDMDYLGWVFVAVGYREEKGKFKLLLKGQNLGFKGGNWSRDKGRVLGKTLGQREQGLHTAEEIESVGFSAYCAESVRQILDKGDLNLMLMLCHKLIACSIAEGSQAPEKVIVTDLFYLRGMDVGSVNIAYLLARLYICEELDDIWAWVALGPERQQVAAVGAPKVAEDALVVDEGALAVLAPVQAPQPPPAARPARTMTQRIARLGLGTLTMRIFISRTRDVLGVGLMTPAP
ncbi:hypothetical protein Tco_1399646 [Tanacetum coccineum]